jgi:hypothetical protein
MRLISPLLCFVVASCLHSPLDPALDGSYRAPNGEILSFDQGRVDHVRKLGEMSEKTFIGVARNAHGSKHQWEIFAPDISPFIGTRFLFDDSVNHVSVEWSDFRSQRVKRESSYKKSGQGEQAVHGNSH